MASDYVKVVATADGYYGGAIRKVGDTFPIEGDVWNDEKRRPSWAQLADGKEPAKVVPHGGNAALGNEAGNPEGVAVVVPGDWQSMPAKERRALAQEIAGNSEEVTNAKQADAIIQDHVDNASGPAFGDAPEPVTIASELGTTEPDWVDPKGMTKVDD